METLPDSRLLFQMMEFQNDFQLKILCLWVLVQYFEAQPQNGCSG